MVTLSRNHRSSMRLLGSCVLVALLAVPCALPASAQRNEHDRRAPARHYAPREQWRGGYERQDNSGAMVGGVLLGLGIGALLGGALAPPPPVVYAPPPPNYYAPPPPVYYGY